MGSHGAGLNHAEPMALSQLIGKTDSIQCTDESQASFLFAMPNDYIIMVLRCYDMMVQ